MRRRIALLLSALGLAFVTTGCVAPYGYSHGGPRYYGGRYASGGYYGVPARTIVVQRPVYVQRDWRHRIHRREWVREHRRHDHRERNRRDWRDWRRRR
jgi:hypothetical protein